MSRPALGHVFGLTVFGDHPIEGLVPLGAPAPERSVEVEHVSIADGARLWSSAAPQRLVEQRRPDGRLFLAVDLDPVAGYRIEAPDYGTQLVSPDGSRVLIVGDTPSAWHVRRLLFTQALPTAAVLQGLDLLHASAVVFDGRLVALTGPSGAGKSTLAAELLARGALFFTDDVLAFELTACGLTAYPGPRVRGLGEEEQQAIRGEESSVGSPTMGVTLAVIERNWERGARPEVSGPIDIGALLGSAFAAHVMTPSRSVTWLDISRRLLLDGSVCCLRAPEGATSATASTLARRVLPDRPVT